MPAQSPQRRQRHHGVAHPIGGAHEDLPVHFLQLSGSLKSGVTFVLKPIMAALWISGTLAAAPRVIAVDVGGIIQPITVEILDHAIDQAAHENAAAVLIRLNTPGGLLDSSREITQKMVSARVPVIAYVTPSGGRAASAGFFLLQAADVAAMAPGTNTGASSPVLLGQQMDPVMRSKVENDSS